MASKRKDLCPNTQATLLAETKADGSLLTKRDECPYCVCLVGAHNIVEQAVASASAAASATSTGQFIIGGAA